MKNTETPPSARVIFGQNVRRVRRLKEMSQEELAFRADISRTYLSEVERGDRNISVDNMEALAQALEMELPDLLRQTLLSLPSEEVRSPD
ncbi:helix-turn-helix domain-containing protein [Herbaspirillum sp. NPDC087042]|uniref:helix-turn-helix domain-containing protein n=1 Tax=Herbaspirillum sp. NPDC087042 TaxID=3364004 RepID=UPI00382396FE